MESGVYCIVLLCLTSALWTEADATTRSADCRGSCPPGWTQLGSRCFIFKNQELNWAHAERDCIGLGGNLASFQSYTELNFVIKLVRTATGQNRIFWAGGNNAVLDGVWLWSDGSKFSPIGWGRRKPNNSRGKRHCMVVNYRASAYKKASNRSCLSKLPFVCSSSLKW